MNTVTREQKRERIKEMLDFFFHKGAEDDDIDAAILADYAPLSEERRAELEERRQVIERHFERADAAVEDNPNISEYAEERRFFEAWLAEIDAELEGDDG